MTTLPVEGDRLPDSTHRWTDASGGEWVLTLNWQVIDGRPECIGMHLEQSGDVVVLTGTVLKDLRIAEKIAEARAFMAPAIEATQGLRASTAARLREAATVYLDAQDRGEAPTKAVAAHFGISGGGASNLVTRARAAGLLPPTSRGVAVGRTATKVHDMMREGPGPEAVLEILHHLESRRKS